MITLTELLNIQDSKTLGAKIFQSGDHNEVQTHLKSLVLQASLTELKQIINVFDENEFFDQVSVSRKPRCSRRG